MKNNNFKENFIPAIVLVCICLVVSLALAATYNVANPTIIANQQKSADEARMEVLPDGDSFTEYKGFGGAVKVMIGIDANGEITGVKVTEHSETPGLGTKAADPGYLKQYQGVSEATAGHINDDPNIDAVTGATITSNAVYGSVVEALAQFKECGGVK